MKPEAQVSEITSPTKKISSNYHLNKFSQFSEYYIGQILYVVKIFHIRLFVLLYALPLFIMAVFCVPICRKLWLRKIPGNLASSNQAVMEMSKRKVVRLLAIIGVVFCTVLVSNIRQSLLLVRATKLGTTITNKTEFSSFSFG